MATTKNRKEIVAQIAEIVDHIGLAQGIEAVDVELLGAGAHRMLRIYIDKPGGVTHGDCELISQKAGALLDEQDLIPGGAYQLEVSSPGVERKLKKPADFTRFRGQKIQVSLREPVDGQKRWEGTLTHFQDSRISLETAAGKTVQFAFDLVQKANLKFEW